MSDRIRRFQLIKKIMETENTELYHRIISLKKLMEKKEASIQVFQGYLDEYQQTLLTQGSHNVTTFVNFQLFLDQIAKVLHKEREELVSLQTKDQELKSQVLKKKRQIDTLNDMLSRLKP